MVKTALLISLGFVLGVVGSSLFQQKPEKKCESEEDLCKEQVANAISIANQICAYSRP